MLPPDVITLIYSFGYPKHKEYINKISNQLTRVFNHNISLLYESYYKLYRLDYVDSFTEFLTYSVEDGVLEELFKQCTKCYCCSRHCHNRPTNYYTDEVSIGENFYTDCNCKCRLLARKIIKIPKIDYVDETDLGLYTKSCKTNSRFNNLFIRRSDLRVNGH